MTEYMTRILRAIDRGTIPQGSVAMPEIRHERWCPLLNGGDRCACNPEVWIETPNGKRQVAEDGSLVQ